MQIDYSKITDLDTAIRVIKKLERGLNNSYSAVFHICPKCGEIMQEGYICPNCSYGEE